MTPLLQVDDNLIRKRTVAVHLLFIYVYNFVYVLLIILNIHNNNIKEYTI